MVCHIGGQLGTKVVISALGMLALYMCFNGTGIWGGETIYPEVPIYRYEINEFRSKYCVMNQVKNTIEHKL